MIVVRTGPSRKTVPDPHYQCEPVVLAEHYLMNIWQLVTGIILSLLLFGDALGMTSEEGDSAPVFPGTVITNRAQLSYIDNATGETVTTLSNEASVTVAKQYLFSLTENQSTVANRDTIVQFAHQLHNIGNVPDAYILSVSSTDSVINSSILSVHHDLNGNGLVDPDEPRIDRTHLLQPGEVTELVITIPVPETFSDNNAIEITLAAESAYGSLLAQSNVDTLTVVSGVSIELNKTNFPECEVPVFPGDVIKYNIAYSNRGDVIPDMQTYVVDGIVRSGVLIEDGIPANTELSADSLPQYSAAGASVILKPVGETDWISRVNWNGQDSIETIGLLLPDYSLQPQLEGFFNFEVKTSSSITTETVIENLAAMDIDADGFIDFVSNTVCNSFAEIAGATVAQLRFIEPQLSLRQQAVSPVFGNNEDFDDAPFYRIERGTRDYRLVRDGVYLELRAASVNRSSILNDGAGADRVIVTVESTQTSDSLQVLMLETGINSGIFRSTRPIALSESITGNGALCPGDASIPLSANFDLPAENCVLKSSGGDTLHATFLDPGSSMLLEDRAAVDPFGITFDSKSLLPVEGTLVKIIDASNDQTLNDPVTGESLELTSNNRGQYEVPRLLPGTRFYLDVIPPAGYSFPSVVAPAQLGGYRTGPYSYGQFGLEQGSDVLGVVTQGPESESTMQIDIPLDPFVINADLSIEKTALQDEIAPGESVGYEVEVFNRGETVLNDVKIKDALPYGYKYIPQSATLSRAPLPDPAGSPGPELEFVIGSLEPGTSVMLSYVLQATAGAMDSDGINRARASAVDVSGELLATSDATARVVLRRDGVLSDKATLFGKVYVDADCNLLQNDAEWPVGGVKLYMEDGTWVITDEDGLYSLYGLSTGHHVIKVDPLTLPEGLQLKALDNRHGADADSRFVELRSGDFHRADFAADCPTANSREVFAELKERSQSIGGEWLFTQATRFNPSAGNPNSRFNTAAVEADGDVSNGIVSGPSSGESRSGDARNDTAQGSSVPGRKRLSALSGQANSAMPSAKKLVSGISTAQAKKGTWVWPEGDISKDGRFMAIVRAGITPQLMVNGRPVDATKIGEQLVNKAASAQIVAWYGVRLKPGINQVEIRGKDPFGNNRIMASRQFKRPGSGQRIVLRAKKDVLPADGGRTTLPIEINIVDENNYPALGVYFVDLESSDGTWVEPDIQDKQPGHQIKIENGRGVINYRSSEFTGHVDLRASSGDMMTQLRVVQVASARELLGVGIVEAGSSWSRLDVEDLSPSAQAEKLDGKNSVDGRVALFLKGKVKGDMQLTFAYDSEKSNRSDLLRDINPNSTYALHGDASVRGFEAQSRSKLYAKLERGKNSIMYGDYLTDPAAQVEDLGRVQRPLTGLNAVFDNGFTRLQAFAARPEELRRVEEIPGNGTAMLFRLQGAPIVPNSEVVELITRDRDNPGLVLSSVRMLRISDYVLDSETGQIRFANTIPSFDEELGRNSLRISYDQQGAGQEYTVAGIRLHQRVIDDVAIGFSHTEDRNPINGTSVSSVWAEYNPGDRTRVAAGVATMSHEDGAAGGRAERLTIEHTWNRKKGRHTSLSLARAEAGFDNPGAGIAADREELRLNHRQNINNTTRLEAEASHSKSLSDEKRRTSASVVVDKTFATFSARAGLRRVSENNGIRSSAFTTALLGLEKSFRIADRSASFGIEYERSLDDINRERLSLDATLALHEHLNAYSRYEYQDSLADLFAAGNNRSETFVAGLETDFIRSTRVYTEYRAKGLNGDRNLENGSGIRGTYNPSEGITVTPALEVINIIDGDQGEDAVAVSLNVNNQHNPNSRTNLHGEIRVSDDSRYFGMRASYAARLDRDWSFLLREDLTHLVPDEGEITSHHSFVAAMARRPKRENSHHMLFMYNWKKDYTPDSGGDRVTHLLSTHQNYKFSPVLEWSGRLGGKWQKAEFDSGYVSSHALLFDTRLSWDINRRLDVDFRAGWLSTDANNASRLSLGAGLYFLLNRNLRIGVGYNLIGFREEDLDPSGYNASGIHIGFQYKFDEDLFQWLTPRDSPAEIDSTDSFEQTGKSQTD